MKIEHYQNKDETEVLNIWLKASEQAHAFAGVGFWCGLVEGMKQVYLPRARTWVCRNGAAGLGEGAQQGSVYEENARACAFYRRGGFEEIGSRDGELTGSREYRMEWKKENT